MTTVALTEADARRTVRARAGDEVVIRLPETPTTGCRWQVERVDGHLAQEGDSFTLHPDVTFGSGGLRELRFVATSVGTARVQLKRWQSWEGERSVDARFEVTIQIDS